VLKIGFAALMVVIAAQFVRRWHRTVRLAAK